MQVFSNVCMWYIPSYQTTVTKRHYRRIIYKRSIHKLQQVCVFLSYSIACAHIYSLRDVDGIRIRTTTMYNNLNMLMPEAIAKHIIIFYSQFRYKLGMCVLSPFTALLNLRGLKHSFIHLCLRNNEQDGKHEEPFEEQTFFRLREINRKDIRRKLILSSLQQEERGENTRYFLLLLPSHTNK